MRPSLLLIAWAVALAALAGCESLQRKFTRKPKHPVAAPSPIIKFQDYSRAMTPMERYRKHYLMYDYWNHELMDSLQQPPLNPKRYRKASAESVTELEVLRSLLDEEAAARLAPLIDERAGIVKRLNGSFSDTQAPLLLRDIELHTGRLHREFKPGEIQESLIEEPPAASPAAADARSD